MNLKFKNFDWDNFISDYQTAVADSAYQAWKSGEPVESVTGVDIYTWFDYTFTPAVNENLTIEFFV